MKSFKKQFALLALASMYSATSALAQVADVDVVAVLGASAGDNLIVDGTLTVETASTVADTGTAPVSSLPIGHDKNTGFTNSGVASTVYQFKDNGSGEQVRTDVNGGGVVAETNGNLTLEVQDTQVTTYNYTIETREIMVSDPAGFVDVNGDYGAAGTFYANGETLPGTSELIATFRDGNDNLLSVLTDIPGVGPLDPLVNVDANGNPILTQAQINTINGSGSAPAGFEDVGTATQEGGDLQVGGNTNVDGTLTVGGVDVGQTLTDIQADVDQNEADSDAADALIQADVDQNEADSDAADALIQADVDQNEADSDAADLALGVRIDDEAAARIAADDAITAAFQAADANLQSQISKNRKDIEANTRGIAMVAALQHTTVLPGMNHALDISAAHFEGETGMSLNYARRINDNVQINFGAASTTDFDESVIKAGIGVQW
jgi:hypothetical protein